MSLPRLQLDFVAAPRRSRLAGVVLLAFSLALSVHLTERYRTVRQELDRSDHRVVQVRPASSAQKKNLDEEIKSAESVVRQLALPWDVMIRAVEGAASADIVLLQLAPEARERRLHVMAEAPGERAMLEYLRKLGAAPELAEVHLARHQVMQDEPRRPTQFTVLARLKGAP